ncbi:MAG: glycosyltransferase family 4 protein [Acidimicrobiia bacterium]|nr:glycosyltransferase family 4 protein [Acidimicrobiia bacterium]
MNRAAAQRFDQTTSADDAATSPAAGLPSPADPWETRPVRVAVDATPLLGPRTGIGQVVAALTTRLASNPAIDLTGYVVSWRARDYQAALPGNANGLRLRWPARLCHRTWRRFDTPKLNGRFDVVHGTNYVVPPTIGGATLVSVHDLTSWWFPELVDSYSRANPELVQRAIDRGAHVQTGAHAVARELSSELDVEPERIHVVVNGFDRLLPGDAQRGRQHVGAPYVLAIGTIEPRKDYVGLVEAMAEVWSLHPEVRLAIVGGNGWGVDDFAAAVGRLQAQDRVIRCGYVSEQVKADLIAGAELLAYPSVYEGFGLPVLEAMDGGLPVVTTRVPAIAEVVGDAAVLVPVQAPTELAGAIVTVLEGDQLRADLRAKGHQRCRQFSWDRAAAEYAVLYQRLASLR